jgi:hypothetical protein
MRKILKGSIYFSAMALLCVAGTGCLKDKLADDQLTIPDIKSSPSVVEMLGAREGTSQMISYAASLISSDKDTTLDLAFIRLAADQPATEDIQVELELDPALITNFNNATGSNYVAPASSLYKFDNGLTVTIPKGSREAGLKFTTKPSALVGPEYAFGVRIKNISNTKYLISGNHNSAVIVVGVRNKYDGDYTLRVNTTGWAAFGISDGVTRTYPLETSMITASATSVALFNQYFGAGLVPAFTSTGDATAFGAATPLFTFDPATDKLVSVVNTTPPDARNRAFALHPTVTDSRFDPVTKTMYLAYVLKQSGRPDMAIYDTLTYVGPRD